MDYEIPIYRVALVREGTLPTDDKKIRNSGSVALVYYKHISLMPMNESELGLYFYDFDEHIQLREVIIGVRCSVTKSSIERAVRDYPKPIRTIKATSISICIGIFIFCD